MPCDYKQYPLDWFTRIRPSILERAGHCCEECGAPNYSLRYRYCSDSCTLGNPSFASAKQQLAESDVAEDFYIVVLMIAHMDHFTMNNNPHNLKALCQKCHNSYDAKHRAKTRRAKRAKALESIAPSLPLVTDIVTTI